MCSDAEANEHAPDNIRLDQDLPIAVAEDVNVGTGTYSETWQVLELLI